VLKYGSWLGFFQEHGIDLLCLQVRCRLGHCRCHCRQVFGHCHGWVVLCWHCSMRHCLGLY